MSDDSPKEAPALQWQSDEWAAWTGLLLNSYERFIGRNLISRGDRWEDSQKLYHAPFVVVAHGTQEDPLLNYANQTAVELWETTLDQLLGMPSRRTAEPVHRDERARLLQRTREFGFIDDYSGIRVSTSGRRFKIHRATVWNVVDDDGAHAGQAAAFSEWTMLTE